uniref:Crp/Fnr family transcriptional regulator n=1 Tax=uncultured Allobacillus sp. TaxID=1638025 RepID=UPI002595473D|nr:Crp/Fnr family transcriptional regulator [uncultured Allobacillus sp.]
MYPNDYSMMNFVNPWLDNLEYDWESVKSLGQVITINKNKTIFHQNESSNYIFVVEKGRVRLTLLSLEGEEKAIAIIGTNGILGECSLNSSNQYATNAVTSTKSRVVRIEREKFITHMMENPTSHNQLMDLITRKYRLLCLQSMELSYTKAFISVCNTFVHLAKEYGENIEDNKIKVTITFTQQEMANLLGITRVSIANHIKDLIDQGYLEKQDKYYVIKDIDGLFELIQG